MSRSWLLVSSDGELIPQTRERTSRRKQRPEVSTDEGEQVGPVAAPEKTALERDPGVQYVSVVLVGRGH